MTDAVRPPSDPLAALAAFADALARGDDLDSTLRRLLEVGLASTRAARAAIVIQDPDRPALELAATAGTAPPAGAAGPADPAGPLARAVAARAAAWDRPSTDEPGAVQADLPLVSRRDGIDLVVGGLTLTWTAGAPDERGRSTAAAVADLAAVAVDRARLASLIAERAEWFERMAQSDPLTGLANQRVFARVLELELARAGRQGGEVSLALFDVDGFVATNEAGGHEAGDRVLRAVAAVLNESVRLVDTVARIGGDEFVLVAPGSAGATVARRVLAGVAALAPVDGRPISVSSGIARFPTDGTTPEELLDAAGTALVAAKERGPATLHEAGTRPTG